MGWYSSVLSVEEPHQSISNLVAKLYYGDNNVGVALLKNSLMQGWKKMSRLIFLKRVTYFKTLHIKILISFLSSYSTLQNVILLFFFYWKNS
jgi:hypothetical protein